MLAEVLFAFLVLAIMAAIVVPWAWAPCSLLAFDTDEWQEARQSQGVWLAVVLVFGWFGAVGYLVHVRPQRCDLRDVAALERKHSLGSPALARR